ncbi:MAG: hypothetical protein OSA45_01155 [Halioglobus sp.]|nr:hypothetical protein [Halioglobus sp.]
MPMSCSGSEIALHLYPGEGVNMARRLPAAHTVLLADRRNDAMMAIRNHFAMS